MKTKYSKKYGYLSNLNSLGALRKAQKSVDRDIKRTEQRIQTQYNNALNAFSYKSLICGFLNKFDDLQAMVRYAIQGYDTVVSIIEERRQSKCE